MVVVLSIGAVVTASERPVLRGNEAPRATDLLRAKRLADQAKSRLRMPQEKSAGWQRGGSGWDETREVATKERSAGDSVAIRVAPPRRRRRPLE